MLFWLKFMSFNNHRKFIEISANNYLDLSQTVIKRMGGYPKYWLEGSGDLSDRDVRKKAIAHLICYTFGEILYDRLPRIFHRDNPNRKIECRTTFRRPIGRT